MILHKLAVSLLLLAIALPVATLWRASARQASIERAFPPEGQFVTIEGRRVHLVISGKGPDLVLIHGASGSLREFTFGLMQRLAKDYRVIAVDRPGHGYSDPIPDASLQAQAKIIKAAVASLGVDRPIVLGQSYGGAVALAWAREGGPSALVLVGAPSLPWPGKLGLWYRLTANPVGRAVLVPLASALVPQSYVTGATEAVFAPSAVPAGYIEHFGPELALRRSAMAANVTQVNELRDQLVAQQASYPEMTLPIELIHGTEDTIVPLNIHSGPLAKILPNVRLTVVEGAGHMPHHSHPEIVIAAIARAALR
jgi:pimeloyl-ACP methyl ester carboxylesterase